MVRCWKIVDVNQKSNGLRIEPCGTPCFGDYLIVSNREKNQDFLHQIGAVNALSLMNCKVKETKTTNVCRTIRLIHLFS